MSLLETIVQTLEAPSNIERETTLPRRKGGVTQDGDSCNSHLYHELFQILFYLLYEAKEYYDKVLVGPKGGGEEILLRRMEQNMHI